MATEFFLIADTLLLSLIRTCNQTRSTRKFQSLSCNLKLRQPDRDPS
uniref:Uncharacterized protein n=1 Tax=Arundo donax TaxID=35708 RepID=A0A0A9EJE5_ARUDO